MTLPADIGLGARIADEVEHIISIVSTLRQVVEGEINEVMRSKNPGIPKGALTQLKEITATLNSLVDAKIRLDKSAKAITEAMTPEQELEAVRSYIRAMEPRRAVAFLDGEIQWRSRNS